MHSKLLVLTVIPAMLISATSALGADAAPAPTSRTDRQARMVERFDTNGDGKLDEGERAAARQAAQDGGGLRGAFMQGYDADKDGTLSEAEKAKAQADWKAFVAKHDADGDGKLSRTEGKAARQAWAKEHPEAAARMRAAVDKNGDGKVSLKERRQAAKEIRKKRQAATSGEN